MLYLARLSFLTLVTVLGEGKKMNTKARGGTRKIIRICIQSYSGKIVRNTDNKVYSVAHGYR